MIAVRDRLKVGYPTFKSWGPCGAGLRHAAAPLHFLGDFAHLVFSIPQTQVEAARGDWQGWRAFFETFVTDAAEANSQAIFEVTRLLADRRERLVKMAHTRMRAVRLEALLPFHPGITVRYAANLLDTAVRTATEAIESLVQCEIVEETTGRQRDKEFADSGFLNVLTAECA